MLNLKRVLKAKPKPHGEREMVELMTPWGEVLDPEHVLSEHPTPQFERSTWLSLNGWWQMAIVPAEQPDPDPLKAVLTAQAPNDATFSQRILVPFSPEAPLSGVKEMLKPDELLWYKRSFSASELPAGERMLLHFQAVDYACACYCNGSLVGYHKSGYTPFTFDITDALNTTTNVLMLCVADPSDTHTQPRGKQRLQGGDIWYTAQSGIWQTVWIEGVLEQRILNVRFSSDASGVLKVAAQTSSLGGLKMRLIDNGEVVATAACVTAGNKASIALKPPHPKLWSPAEPHLYAVEMEFGEDHVKSYCAFRSVSVEEDDQGTKRVFLNGEPIFLKGVLDQGYWPDGLMTAPADEALIYDIEAMKAAGFNMLRKHIKIESERWYYHCDRLGMLVWQDMVCGGSELNSWHTSYKPTLFSASWDHFADDTPKNMASLSAADEGYQREWSALCLETIEILKSHPCIITWVLFNEGWGQFKAAEALAAARAADPTRPIDAVSGWFDQHCGNFRSDHNYFRTLKVRKDKERAYALSEFGGLSFGVAGHCACTDSYGYGDYEDLGAWRKAVAKQLEKVDSLQEKGLAAYVYTQLADVEEEVNGLLSYDRKVNKLVD